LSGISGIRVARSTDKGVTFTDATGDLPNLVNVRCILVDPTNENVIYIGTDFGVYVSFNQGTNWQNNSQNLPAVCYVNDLEFDPYSIKIAAATYGRGVFISDRATINSVENDNYLSKSFNLFNNYPNPFNPVTTIKYEINEPGFISLKVFDVLGSEVATLVNEDKVSGSYQIQFDASKLPSGSYYYKLSDGKYSETKKMILLK
jgi:hypothetical protein